MRIYAGLLMGAYSVYMFRTGEVKVKDYSKPRNVFGSRPLKKGSPFDAKVEAVFTGALGLLVAFAPGKDEV